jgi:hypothetical protein
VFETLEPPEQVVARRWPLLLYGVYLLGGLVYVIFGVRRHGFSQPISLAIGCVMFFLSLTWLVTTLKSRSSLTNREFGVRIIILVSLQMAQELPSLFR